MLEAVLRKTPFFATLPAEAVTDLAETLAPREFPAGAVLFREGEIGDRFFILLDGQVEIVKSLGADGEHVLALRGPGDHIGEMSLLQQGGARMASGRTRTPVRVVEVTRGQLDMLLHRYPMLGYQLARITGDRLTQAHARSIEELEEQNRQLRAALDELHTAQAELLEKKQLERELALARDIQMSMLPAGLPELPGYGFGARLLPMSLVGGDFYDFIPLEDDHLGIAVGDVSGHGVPAALIMAVTVALLRAEACRRCPPAEVLLNINAQLLRLNSRQMFVTALYGVLDRHSGEFVYARAGHELPVLITESGSARYLDGHGGRLLGLFANPPIVDVSITMQPGETLLLYTDGVTEARNAQDFFGEERLLYEAGRAACSGPQTLCERLLASALAFSGLHAQDDITLAAISRAAVAGAADAGHCSPVAQRG